MSKVKVIEKTTLLTQWSGGPKIRTVENYDDLSSEYDLENAVREISDHYGLRIQQKRIVALIVNE